MAFLQDGALLGQSSRHVSLSVLINCEVRPRKIAANTVHIFYGQEFLGVVREKHAHDDTNGFPFGSLMAVANKTN